MITPRLWKRSLAIALAAMLLSLGASAPEPAAAAPPERVPQIVYGGNVWNGRDVVSTFYPQTVRTIYLLAEETSVLTARETLVYYWPIERQYRADWESLNQVVTGTLEVLGGGETRVIRQTVYIVQYEQGPNRAPVIYLGDTALERWRVFQAARDAYNEGMRRFYEEERAYLAALDEAAARRARGETVTVPTRPQAPPAFTWLSTQPHPGFPVKLPAGRYRLRLRGMNGQVVAGTERDLEIIAPRRFGVTYQIVPEARWTVPERSDDPGNVLYGRAGTRVYLQPMRAMLVNDLAYTRLEDPQSRAGRSDRWRWVDIGPLEDLVLHITAGGTQRQETMQPFAVRQLPGTALGYEVVPYEAGSRQSPDIVGYPLLVETATIRLLAADGAVVSGSDRVVRPIRRLSDVSLISLVLLPLALGGWARRGGHGPVNTTH